MHAPTTAAPKPDPALICEPGPPSQPAPGRPRPACWKYGSDLSRDKRLARLVGDRGREGIYLGFAIGVFDRRRLSGSEQIPGLPGCRAAPPWAPRCGGGTDTRAGGPRISYTRVSALRCLPRTLCRCNRSGFGRLTAKKAKQYGPCLRYRYGDGLLGSRFIATTLPASGFRAGACACVLSAAASRDGAGGGGAALLCGDDSRGLQARARVTRRRIPPPGRTAGEL